MNLEGGYGELVWDSHRQKVVETDQGVTLLFFFFFFCLPPDVLGMEKGNAPVEILPD